jgi:hypothetical protein
MVWYLVKHREKLTLPLIFTFYSLHLVLVAEKEAGRWKLHNEENYNLYYSPNIIRVLKSRNPEMEAVRSFETWELYHNTIRCQMPEYNDLKDEFGVARSTHEENWREETTKRPRRWWKDNIKIGLSGSGCEDVD